MFTAATSRSSSFSLPCIFIIRLIVVAAKDTDLFLEHMHVSLHFVLCTIHLLDLSVFPLDYILQVNYLLFHVTIFRLHFLLQFLVLLSFFLNVRLQEL